MTNINNTNHFSIAPQVLIDQ